VGFGADCNTALDLKKILSDRLKTGFTCLAAGRVCRLGAKALGLLKHSRFADERFELRSLSTSSRETLVKFRRNHEAGNRDVFEEKKSKSLILAQNERWRRG
jgi:hypothetical protein